MQAIDNRLRLILPALKNLMKDCAACGTCLQNCYLSNVPPKIAEKTMQAIKEYVEHNFKTSLPSFAKTIIWRCCIDEYCYQFCPNGISKAQLMIGLRFSLLQKGMGPFQLQVMESLLRKTLDKDPTFTLHRTIMRLVENMTYPLKWKKDRNRREMTERLERAKNPRLDLIEKGSTLFMPGCGHTYGMPNIVQLTMAILDKVNVKYHTIGIPEFCCGGVFAVAGFLKASYLIGMRTGRLLAKLKPARIITACPGCYMAYTAKGFPTGHGQQSFKLPISETLADAGIEVLHLSEFLEQLIKSGQIKFKRKIERAIAILPSCSTGKRNVTIGKGQIAESQFEILKSIPGVDFRELTYSGDQSRCCGVTAKLTQKVISFNSIFNPDLAFKSQQEVVTDVLTKGVRDVATVCGGCEMIYNDGLKQMGGPIRVWDLVEIIAYAMGITIYPRDHEEMQDWIKLSPPFIKTGILRVFPRIINLLSAAFKYYF
ncbi:MAG: (Fe-S)-binding protein [Candidatus Helarchaeota archaeon]